MHGTFARREARLMLGLAVMALSLAVAGGAGAQTPTLDRITVDAGAVTRTLPAAFFGVNYVGFWDDAQG